MPKAAALPPLNRNQQRAAAKASRERNDGRKLMTVEDVAEHLCKSRHSVYRIIRSGELRTIQVEGTLRVRPSDLDDYLDRRVVS